MKMMAKMVAGSDRSLFFYSILFSFFFYKEGVTVGSRQASLVIEYLQSCLRKQTQAEKGFSIGMREG